MKRGALFVQISIVLVIFAVFNVGVARLSKNVPWRVCYQTIKSAPKFDVLGLGNSLMEHGFNGEAFDQARKNSGENDAAIHTHITGLGGTESAEHLELLRQVIKRQDKCDTLIYGFYDFQLTRLKPPVMFGNRSLVYFLEPNIAAQYYAQSGWERMTFPLIHYVPYLTERAQVWGRVEKLRREMSEVGMPHQTTNEFGRTNDFSLLEAADGPTFAKYCTEDIQTGISAPVQEIARFGKQHAKRVVFVCMPMSPIHREVFYSVPEWSKYQDFLRSSLAKQGVELIDASNWIPSQNDFSDHLHLNKKGSYEFSTRLGQEIAKSQ